VSINGSKRRVVSAQLVAAGASAQGEPDRPIVSGPIAINVWPATGPGRTLVLAIDSSSFEPDVWQRTQLAARAFLSQLDANDRVGFFAFPFGPALDVTSDRARVIRAIGATAGASQSLRTTFHLSPAEIIDISAEIARSTSPGTAVRRTRSGALEGGSDAPTVQRVQDRECPNDPNCAARILMDADNSANLLEARAARGVAGLQSLLTVLAGLEGRKTVVLLSGGLAASDIPGGRPVVADLARTLGEQLAQANAAIYTLHFNANLRSAVSATQQQINLGTTDAAPETTLMGRWLEQFSAASGGALLRVQTDDGESAFQRACEAPHTTCWASSPARGS
jgi:hypothetical protein